MNIENLTSQEPEKNEVTQGQIIDFKEGKFMSENGEYETLRLVVDADGVFQFDTDNVIIDGNKIRLFANTTKDGSKSYINKDYVICQKLGIKSLAQLKGMTVELVKDENNYK